ncbi:hypothetical protein CC1G_15185 [Coprinopsis cinerea okayama7|uniref:Uncharacterized protein n=1 Tax=Coprinopsis cinerea (strain Okayama-7 / 130 / ATCC MYA-4618 / FGSC 9003) TaxID=240176 RepID=D6RPN4_COPC7|nr:hypothetical protein CC1G_15185 [Coprinopsis cinerea okayama7\|eukprot:XP_002910548.1 hypothetical protein CC1G_15185 [Coprinopsis cinerea okayama7\
MKAYMSQPMLARQLLDDNEQERRRQGRHPRQSGDSGESSSSSASPIDDREPSDEFPLPRSSMDPNEPPHDHRRRSRTLSLQSLYRKEASRKESATDAPQNASTGNGRTDKPSADTDPRAQVDRLPPTPPPKSPSLFKRKRSGTNPQQAVPTDSSVPVTASSSQSSTNSGFKSLTKVLVRRASRSRIKTLRPEGESDVPPVPPIPTPFLGGLAFGFHDVDGIVDDHRQTRGCAEPHGRRPYPGCLDFRAERAISITRRRAFGIYIHTFIYNNIYIHIYTYGIYTGFDICTQTQDQGIGCIARIIFGVVVQNCSIYSVVR